MEASQDIGEGSEGFVTRYNIGDRVIFANASGDVYAGTVQSITLNSAGVFYDVELGDEARTVVPHIPALEVEPAAP